MTTTKENFVSMASEPLQVYWFPYRDDLVQAFNHMGFDNLVKLGYPIWDDVDYDAEDIEGQYAELLKWYKTSWCRLAPIQQARKLTVIFKITEDELVDIIQNNKYEYFQ